MHLAAWLVALVATVLVISVLADRIGFAAPLVLTGVGVAASFVPAIPDVPLEPEVVLVGLLPPLLFAAARRGSIIDFKENALSITSLSVGLVLFTAFAVGIVTTVLLDVPFAVGLALGAVVGPPDAVAATAVGRRIGLPRRITTLLEGESLLNDATAIVLLRTAIAAIAGTVGFWQVAGSFALSAVGGVVIGVAVAALVVFATRRSTDPVVTTCISYITPWIAYLPAEEVHASGVVAVVIAGLIIAFKSPTHSDALGRVSAHLNWNSVQFLLENVVFLLIGLQMRQIITDVNNSPTGWGTAIIVCVAVLLTVILARIVWSVPAALIAVRVDNQSTRMSPRETAVLSWAGMRGVVTLAAAFILPEDTPERPVLVLAAMVVVAGTLLLHGSTLPALSRKLGIEGPNAREDALQWAVVMRSAINAGVAVLDRVEANKKSTVPAAVIDDLRRRADFRSNANWERLGPEATTTPDAIYRRIRMKMLTAERGEVLRLRNLGQGDHEVIERVLFGLDVEESMLNNTAEVADRTAVSELLTPLRVSDDCEHLRASGDEVDDDPAPLTDECPDCLIEGTHPVKLRICLTCGYVGCCDSSERKHATRHFEQTRHPVIRSFESGERWRWCYIDEKLA